MAKFKASAAELVWHGDYPLAVADAVRENLASDLDDGLAKASDLIFHTVFLSDDWENGPVVIVWGRSRDKRLHCEYHASSELVSLADEAC